MKMIILETIIMNINEWLGSWFTLTVTRLSLVRVCFLLIICYEVHENDDNQFGTHLIYDYIVILMAYKFALA